MTNQNLLLLAERETSLQLAMQEALEGKGYTVIGTSSGMTAMRVMEERYRELAGLITDIRLGKGHTGWELARRARELNPTIAVVYETGVSASGWAAYGVPKSIVLQKPFPNAQLITAISSLLSESDMPSLGGAESTS